MLLKVIPILMTNGINFNKKYVWRLSLIWNTLVYLFNMMLIFLSISNKYIIYYIFLVIYS